MPKKCLIALPAFLLCLNCATLPPVESVYFTSAPQKALIYNVGEIMLEDRLEAGRLVDNAIFLPDDAFANRCVDEALRELLRRPDVAAIEIEAGPTSLADTNRRTRELEAARLPVPRWDIERAPTYLKDLVQQNRGRFVVRESSVLRQP